MDNVLATLLGSKERAKILRLFALNTENCYSKDEVAKLTKSKKDAVTKELKLLLKISFIKDKQCTKEIKEKGKTKSKKEKCYCANKDFKYFRSIKRLIFDISPAEEKEIKDTLTKGASLKLLLVSGVFLQEDDAVVDLLIVADKIKPKQLENAISNLEANVGKELRYSIFSTDDFKYRVSMYDKLLRDVLDRPYKELVNKLGDFWKEISMV